MADQPGAIWLPVPHQNVFQGYWGNKPKWVVIHKTASGGSAQDIARFFVNDPAKASTHYVVGQDGTIVQCVSEADGAGGNCCLEAGHAAYLPTGINMNLLTISIEHVDPATDNSTPLTDAQKAASFTLVRDICQRHGIPMRAGDANGGIIGHHDIAPLSRARCPGNYPMDELLTSLQAGGDDMAIDIHSPNVGNFFDEVDAQHWKCKSNGLVIHDGMLGFYKANNGLLIFGLPLSNEVTLDARGNTKQYMERGCLVYDPQKKYDNPPGSGMVYVAHVYDNGAMGEDPLIPKLEATIAQQQATITQLQSQPATDTVNADKVAKIKVIVNS